jgi:two-component system CheB/CheR fusion protein
MLLLEHAQELDAPPVLQVFACDLDDAAIKMARAGHYHEPISADVSEERLRRFFVKDHHGYRVRRELRELVLFATHDLLKDPPFSRMDLISCRNLLIYLNRDAQERLLETFHFALKPDKLLFLGTSESVDESSSLFRVLDKKNRIYIRQNVARPGLLVPVGPSSLLRVIEAQQRAQIHPAIHGKRFEQESEGQLHGTLKRILNRESAAELHFRLLERLAPPSVLINTDHELVHLSERAGDFLQFSGGEPSTNLLHVVHPMLRAELLTALLRAKDLSETVESLGAPAEIDGRSCLVDIRVTPAQEIAPGYLLVTFERHGAGEPTAKAGNPAASAPEPVARHLERELEQVKGRLRDTIEQYEGSTEELKSGNEELQAMNEELRSATEELETSREELQSINEELTTLNQEMKGKMDEVAHANSDLQNLMASTSIATVFLDRDLAITRYTPSAVDLFHLIPGDLGRPLEHLKHRLDYPELIADVEQVLRTLVPIEREVRGDGKWFLARLQPYRTVEDHIAGAVLTFVDVTDRRNATEALREQLAELERFNIVAVGRETRMIELKKEINELCTRLNEAPRYPLEFESKEGGNAGS